MQKQRRSLVIDGVEILDPSPWFAEADERAMYSTCNVRWMTFAMGNAPMREVEGDLFYHTPAGKVRVRHFEADNKTRVSVPMPTEAEVALMDDIAKLAAFNLARLETIDFIVDPSDFDERKARNTGFARVE